MSDVSTVTGLDSHSDWLAHKLHTQAIVRTNQTTCRVVCMCGEHGHVLSLLKSHGNIVVDLLQALDHVHE
eukprot:2966902-Amphidinium_carterae.1